MKLIGLHCPMPLRYRWAVMGTGPTRRDRLTVLVGYFFIWTVFGIFAFALGVAQAEIEMALAS